MSRSLIVKLVTVIVVAAWVWVLAQQMTTLQQYQWEVAPAHLVLALVAGSIYFAGLGWSWSLLLNTMVAPTVVSSRAATRVWLMSMITRYIPGNIWHIVGRVSFATHLNVNKTHVLSSAAIEQVLTLLGAFGVFLVTVPFYGIFPEEYRWLLWVLLPGVLLLHPQILGRALRVGARLVRRPELAWEYRFQDMARLLACFTLANLFNGVALCILMAGLTPVAPSEWAFLIGAACLAWLLGYLSFLTPSGLGVREAVLAALLTLVYPAPVALVASLLFRVVLTLGEAMAAAVAWLDHQRTTRPSP